MRESDKRMVIRRISNAMAFVGSLIHFWIGVYHLTKEEYLASIAFMACVCAIHALYRLWASEPLEGEGR
jgi:hypothetical protein